MIDPAIKLFGKTIPLQVQDFQSVDNKSEKGMVKAEADDALVKKPDKIIPCPRCNSLETKFCYYNNYNVNQPRHFCKKCQRYWTAGGTMRNVPVGAGRRKNKHLAATHPPRKSSEIEITAENEETPSSSCTKQDPAPQNPLPCYPWVYPWNTTGGDANQMQWASTPMLVAPASYWGCITNACSTGPWNMSWNQSPSPTTLGKHSREDKVGKCLWAPKTLRIDDPTEAAKSSIWDTLGISPTKSEPILKGGIFKAFQPKTKINCSVSDTSQLLQANPAALSRSQAFQETV